MAVKVMWAQVTRANPSAAPAVRDDSAQPAPASLRAVKPKRRRASVYDADGNEVFITLVCLKCHKARPLAQFGLRKMADGAIRNQPWCKTCRAGASAKPEVKEVDEPSAVEESSVSEESPPAIAPTGNLAAQIAAALHAGRR